MRNIKIKSPDGELEVDVVFYNNGKLEFIECKSDVALNLVRQENYFRKMRKKVNPLKNFLEYFSPSFDYLATDNCVESYLKGIIRYDDYKGKNLTFHFLPFEIQYTCNLLIPEQISKSDFEKKTIRMEDMKLSFK